MKIPDKYIKLTKFIKTKFDYLKIPQTAIVLGTGLGQWMDSLQPAITIPYTEIPNFPEPTVQSHKGQLVYAYINSTPVLILQGRFHLYEDYTPEQICIGIRLLGMLGIENVIITNASGALNPKFSTGSIMVITDHINMTGYTPLLGPNVEEWGPRFPDMSCVYDVDLQQLAISQGMSLGIRLERGVYVGVLGPAMETPAETRAYKRAGGDAIGMSTVIEAIAAKHMGMKILGLSCLTNKNIPDCMQETSFEDIILQAEKTASDLGKLLNFIVPLL